MASKLAFNSGRLAVSRFPAQVNRCLSCSAVRWEDAKAPGQTVAKVRARRGLTAFLYDKTGVTGAWTLGIGVSAYLISKEYYVMNGETLLAMVLGGVGYYLMKKLTKPVTEYLDGKSQEIMNIYVDRKNDEVRVINETIDGENSMEEQAVQTKDLIEIMRDVNAMKLETEYRRRQDEVKGAVLKRLNYHVDVEAAQRKHEHQHLLEWIKASVTDSVKGKQDESFDQCMNSLKKMNVA